MNKNGLRELLEVPSFFLQEHRMVEYIETQLAEMNDVFHWKDKYGNIYAVKGVSDFYPLVCAHTDTVHHIEPYTIEEFDSPEGSAFRGVSLDRQRPSGCGGDNKTGIFTCLELLKSQGVLKVAFFIGEEYGCIGSIFADPVFFEDVAYALEFDAPDYFWVTHTCNGIPLFNPAGEFWAKARPIMMKHADNRIDPMHGNHPYTDVHVLKGFYDFACLNYSSGYMRMHTRNEYVVIDYVFKAISTAITLLSELGNTKYSYTSQTLNRDMLMVSRQRPEMIKYPTLEPTLN